MIIHTPSYSKPLQGEGRERKKILNQTEEVSLDTRVKHRLHTTKNDTSRFNILPKMLKYEHYSD